MSKGHKRRLRGAQYDNELFRLQAELVKVQEWVRAEGQRVVVVFEGRDAAGKGGAIKRITQYLNPRVARIAALPAPTERQRGQWYFQRYVEHLPARGEIVLFDRSWYNRAGVERVMGFCTPEQQRRFRGRMDDPMRRWKLSTTDLDSITRWEGYSRAKDEMMVHTDIPEAPWYVVEGDVKKEARLNMMAHLLSTIPYSEVEQPRIVVPERPVSTGYERPPRELSTYVPDHVAALLD